MRETPSEYSEFIGLLNDHGVDYLVGGAYAVAFHAVPRFTEDVDIYVRRTEQNAKRVLKAIREFFSGKLPPGATIENLKNPDAGFAIGVKPVKIDILVSPATTTFRKMWDRRVESTFDTVWANYISVEDLIAEKEHFAREHDLADVAALKRHLEYGAAKKKQARKKKSATKKKRRR